MNLQNIQPMKDQLITRRVKLQKAINDEPGNSNFESLLSQVDKALHKMDEGKYGICEICNETIEEEYLATDPLARVCLSHLNDKQQRALEADLEFAAKIQNGLLPQNNFTANGWDFSYHYRPAGIVSGDFCDIIPVNNNSVVFALGDVSGKGVGASLMMSQLHALIRSLISFDLPVSEIVKKTNRLFCESAVSSNYATLVLGKVDKDGGMELCVAGHNPPLLMQNGKLRSLKATGIPVGLFCNSEYEIHKFKLDSDDYLLLYTDGLTESSVNDIEYGEERLTAHLHKSGVNGSRGLIESLLNDHKSFLQDSRPSDDITIAVLKRDEH